MAVSDLSCSGDQSCNKALATVTLSEGIRKVAFRHLLETHQPMSVGVLTRRAWRVSGTGRGRCLAPGPAGTHPEKSGR